MGMPVVKVAAGGLPVTIVTSGGLPCTEATNGFGIAVTEAPAGSGGLAVTGFTFGPTVALSAASVLETAAINTTVGTLSVSGSYTGTPVFTLADSAGGKFNISGTTLRTNAALDYETATSHSITVAVSGTTPATPNKSFTIAVLDVVAAAAPVLALTSGATDTTPDFLLSGDLALNDVVRFQYSTAADFTGASELTNAIDAGEDAANSISFSTGALALGAWYFRARIERPDAPVSGWSNTVTVTLVAGAYDASTTAWINAVVAAGGTVSDTQKTRVDALIVGLKADGLFSTNSRLWVHAGESVSQQATIDLMGLVTATLTGTPPLSASGYTGNGTTRYINYGALPTNYTQNAASYGAYNTRNNTTQFLDCFMGVTGSSCFADMGCLYDGAGGFGRVNSSGGAYISYGNANRRGMFLNCRRGETEAENYYNGPSSGTNSATGVTMGFTGGFYGLACNSSGTAASFSSEVIAAAWIGGALSDTEAANLTTRVEAYMDAWGVGVI